MAQQPPQPPPPPPPQAYGPPAGSPRPPGSTAPGVLLIILGVIYALIGAMVTIGGGQLAGTFGGIGSAVIIVGLLVIAYGVVEIIAGVKVIGGRNGWRIGGIVLTSIGALLALVGVIQGLVGQEEVTGFDPNTFEPITSGGGPNIGALVTGLLFLAANVVTLILLARLRPAQAAAPGLPAPPA